MRSILGQSAPQAQPLVFTCAQCGEMINTSMAHCAYCSAPVDPRWAAWASNAQAIITSGFDQANNIMHAARGFVVLSLASFLPCGGAIAGLGFFIMIFVFPILVLSWFSKYQWGLQGIDKNHEDFKQSRRRIMKASIIWGAALALRPALGVVVALVFR